MPRGFQLPVALHPLLRADAIGQAPRCRDRARNRRAEAHGPGPARHQLAAGPAPAGRPANGGAGLCQEQHRPRAPGPPGLAVWGDTLAEAAQANEDTFHYTNAAPQAAKFNQGLELWLGMESYLLDHAAGHRRRIVVFTGPIFSDVHPVYRGVDIPLRFSRLQPLSMKMNWRPPVTSWTRLRNWRNCRTCRVPAHSTAPRPWARSVPSRHRSVTSPNFRGWIWSSWPPLIECRSQRRSEQPPLDQPGGNWRQWKTWILTSTSSSKKLQRAQQRNGKGRSGSRPRQQVPGRGLQSSAPRAASGPLHRHGVPRPSLQRG